MAYLHGVETIEIDSGTNPVQMVKTAVIGLVGIAPTGPVNEITLITNEYDGRQFGSELPGFTIPQALRAIYGHGVALIVAINVCDPEKHATQITDETITFDSNGLARTNKPALTALEVRITGESAEICALGVDYTVDMNTGEIRKVTGGKLSASADATVTYTYTDPTKVTSADLIGTIDAVTGVTTGMKAWGMSNTKFGYNPRILIAPGYSSTSEVSAELISQAEKLEAIAYIDAPVGLTVQQVIEGRGATGTINFNTSSERARLLYPHVKVYDLYTDTEELRPLSAYAAGLRAKVDIDRGYWWSNSNHEILGITGMERYLTAQIDDPTCETNLLNEVGITTIFNAYGTGYRLWGNRTAAWPTVTHIKNFKSARRTADMINESLRMNALQYIDRPINQALIDALVESGCAFMRKLTGDGAIIGGKVWFDSGRNPKEELALGHLLLNYKFTPPPPLEHLTQEVEITDEYLVTLKGAE